MSDDAVKNIDTGDVQGPAACGGSCAAGVTGEAPAPEDVPNPADQPALEITRVASAACFGVGNHADAVDRMADVGMNLILLALRETGARNRTARFHEIVGNLALAVGFQVMYDQKPEAKDEAKAG